jgi:hypothetical protein
MGLLQQIKHDVKAGWVRLRYGTVRAAVKALEESELLQLRLEVRRLDGRIKELCRDIGERAVELHERGESSEQVLADLEIARGAEQVQALKAERGKLMAEMDDVRSGE